MRYANESGYYELNAFPGCNQLVVSNHAFIFPSFRGAGRGKGQHEERLRKIKEMGYNAVICTVRADNTVERHILTKYKWTRCFEFLNTETGHLIEVWMREV